MPGTSNFKVFNESLGNIEDDATYLADIQRLNGVIPGQAKSILHNKLFRQTSIMAAALGQFMANTGYDASDSDLNALITSIGNTFATTQALANAINNIPASPVTSVNTKTGAVTLAASDVGAVPTSRKVNNKALSSDVTLSASDINTSSGSSIESQLADMKYQTAGGTATAITLTINGTLATGYAITFIAKYTDSTTSKTINGKKFYKPGTTTSPNTTVGKAYTAWYDSTGDSGNGCFFIKASATGTATTAQVLAGVPFSSEVDTDLAGTMPNNGALNYTPSSSTQTIPAGYTSGGTVNAMASNIKSIQRGTTTMSASATSNTVTIASVDLTKAIVRITHDNNDTSSPPYGATTLVQAVLTDSTTITFTRISAADNNIVDISWEVIEFNNVKSLQRGTTSINATSGAITISSVNLSKSLLFFSEYGGYLPYSNYIEIYLNTATSIQYKRYDATIVLYISWQVIEFN